MQQYPKAMKGSEGREGQRRGRGRINDHSGVGTQARQGGRGGWLSYPKPNTEKNKRSEGGVGGRTKGRAAGTAAIASK